MDIPAPTKGSLLMTHCGSLSLFCGYSHGVRVALEWVAGRPAQHDKGRLWTYVPLKSCQLNGHGAGFTKRSHRAALKYASPSSLYVHLQWSQSGSHIRLCQVAQGGMGNPMQQGIACVLPMGRVHG